METVTNVHVAPSVRSYILDLVESTRAHPLVAVGASPRAALALIRVSSALAVASGRSFVTPDDVQVAAVPSLAIDCFSSREWRCPAERARRWWPRLRRPFPSRSERLNG